MSDIFPGARLFQIKATHGVPLDITLDLLFSRHLRVDWQGFVDEARRNHWWDFQTLDVVQNALAEVLDHTDQQAILLRLKRYMLENRLQ